MSVQAGNRAASRPLRLTGLFLLLVLLAFVVLYTFNLGGWLMHDDEGAAFYEVWQLQQGGRPGVDFIAENQPLFLLAGSTIVGWAGRDPGALRVLSVVQVLGGAFILAAAVWRMWNGRIAALAIGLVLANGLVYEQARIFRPDAMMLGWEMAGLATVLVALEANERRWWSLAGACYGLAVLWKLFGLFPVVGLALYFLDRLRRRRQNWRRIVGDGIAFALPFLLVGGGTSLLLYGQLGFYYGEAFSYHAAMGQSAPFLAGIAQKFAALLLFILISPIFICLPALWFVNRRLPWKQTRVIRLLLWQIASLGIFVFVTRPLHPRYFMHLIPVLALLMAWQVDVSLRQLARTYPRLLRMAPLIAAIFLVAALISTQPFPLEMALSRDEDTHALAALIAQRTAPGDVVLADYATLNFLADRPSIYEAPIIAGGQIESGAVTAGLLLRRIEENNVQMVLIHVSGGWPSPHHMVRLDEYDAFRQSLNENFELLAVFDRNGQKIEVYER